MGALPFQLIVISSIAVFSFFLFRKLRILGHLQDAKRFDRIVERLKSVLFIGILQKKMIGGEKKPGVMHAFIFWGFMIILIRKIQLFVIAFDEFFVYPGLIGGLYATVKDLMSFAVILAVLYALYRRFIVKPKRLEASTEAVAILLLILTIMTTDFLYDAFKFALHSTNVAIAHEMAFAPIGSALSSLFTSLTSNALEFGYHFFYWLQITVVFTFLTIIPITEHMHIVTSLPDVFFRDLDRKGKVPSIDLEAIMNEDDESDEEPVIGINTAADLTWKEGLDAFTCTECGRCKDSCPTFVTEKPLSMMWMNVDIREHLVENEAVINGELQDTDLGRLVIDVIKEDTIWACTSCGYCETACPIDMDHLPRLFKMRQNLVMMETEFPEELANVFNNYENQSNPWAAAANTRADWAKDLNLKTIETADDMKEVDYLYYVGSAQSFDPRNQRVAKAVVEILNKAGVRFGILGANEKSTGECVRRLGNEMLFQEMAGELVETLNERSVRKIITCDPHAFNTLNNEYSEFGGFFEVIHHSQLIDELITSGKIEVTESFEKVIYHDPCYLGRHNDVFDEPRHVIDKITKDTPLEFSMNREKSMCCGAGGGRMWMEETIGSRINETRVDQAMEQEPNVIATGCPYCLIMMEEATGNKNLKEKVAPKDIAELVLESLV